MKPFAFMQPRSVSEATAAASTTVAQAMIAGSKPSDDFILKAGGIDLLDLMKEEFQPHGLVDLHLVPDLDRVTDMGLSGIHVGPLVTLAKLAANPIVRERYSALAGAAGASASPQIRNVATLGGNLLQRPRCWYFRSKDFHCLRNGGHHCFAIEGENRYHAIFDNQTCAIVHPSTVATALVALGAIIELTNARGEIRTMPLEAFLISSTTDVHRENDLQSQELLSAVRLPFLSETTRSVHLKQGETDSFDWPIADVAVVLDLAPDGRCVNAAVVLGAAAPVPYRARAAEAFLTETHIDETIAREAAKLALGGATPLAQNAYKIPLLETLVRRAILAAAAGMAVYGDNVSRPRPIS
jgi:xanthine dehydrogenase YagS FAD-binding subunit